jgi:hypothetical protein
MTNWPPGDLRRAGTSYPPPMVQYEITDIPLTTQTALTPLVQQITASAPTPYDKAAAIQSYLEQNCFYTDQEPVTPPLGDSVVYFVLTTKRGACDVFSAAMTMMLRISGVPARVATGFVSGPADVDEPDKNDIRSKDAHAWVEVYFPGYGWVPFNPAPDRELEQQTVWTLLHSGQTLYVAGQLARKLALGLMAAVGLALFLAGVADPRLIRARLVSFREGWNPWERAARECTRAAATALAVGGLRPAPGETPLEMLERLTVAPRPVLPQPLAQLRTLTAQFYEARFGPNPPSAAQPGSMARDFRRLRKRLRRRKR